MRYHAATLLVILAIGCTTPENPAQELPVASPEAPTDSQPAAEPALDPVIALTRLDAVLETDDQGRLRSITASGPLIDDKVLKLVGSLKTLVTLNIEYSEITDEGLAHLASLDNLETLILRGTEITDKGLARLETLATVTEIDIEFAPVTSEGVARLQKALPGCTINH